MNLKYLDIYNEILNKLKVIKKDKSNRYDICEEYSIKFENHFIKCSMFDENYYYITFSYLTYDFNRERSFKGFNTVKVKVPDDFDEYEFYKSHQNIFIDCLENVILNLKLQKELDISENSCIVKETKRRM